MSFTRSVFAEPIKVLVDNTKLELPVQPVIVEGRTLVPLRAIFETMGASVEWEQATKTVTGKQGNKIIRLQIDNKIAEVDGNKVALDSPAKIINGSTLVPVRFIAESLGADVDWDNNTRSVLVNSDFPYGKYKVIRVVDGDTLEVDYNGSKERVRLIGVDTPESVHPDGSRNSEEGKVASDFTKSKLEGKEIALEFDVQERDPYGRLLAYVWFGGEMFNKVLLQEGYAKVATYPPNVKYVEEFTTIQSRARENNKGLWNMTSILGSGTGTGTGSGTGMYMGSIKSDKYHYPTYTHPGQISDKNLIWFESIEDAKAQGYEPCGYCFK